MTRPASPESRLCTIFDILRQVEFVQAPACADGPTLLLRAQARAKHFGSHVQGRVISSEMEGLPSPQVCIHSAVHPSYIVLPWRLPSARHEICTVPVERDASALRAAIQLEIDCGLARAQRVHVAKGVSQVRVNHVPVLDPFAAYAFSFADTAVIASAEARFRRRTPECIWHVDAVDAGSHIMIHRHGQAPVTVASSYFPLWI